MTPSVFTEREAAREDHRVILEVSKNEENTVAINQFDLLELVRKVDDDQADIDFLREGIRILAQALMDADVTAQIGAGHGERNPEGRVTHRNGYRDRRWDTRAGTVELRIPKVREGTYYPDWLLEPRRRAEKALASVVMQAYVEGVSTRRVDDVARAMGVQGISRSQVSRICKDLDATVESWRTRPLDAGPYPFLWIDALCLKIRQGGRVVNTSALLATAVNADGRREIVGLQLGSSETGAGWTAFLRDLVARGLHGVQLVTSDAHGGLKDAIAAVLDGAQWQRCRTHFTANLLDRIPRHDQPMVGSLVRTIFAQQRPSDAWDQLDRVTAKLDETYPDAATMLRDAAPDVLAYTAYPKDTWRRVWSNNPQERLNREIRRRTDVVGIFPDRASVIRLVGAVLAEQHDEWQVGRRYMNQSTIREALITVIDVGDTPHGQEVKQLQTVTA